MAQLTTEELYDNLIAAKKRECRSCVFFYVQRLQDRYLQQKYLSEYKRCVSFCKSPCRICVSNLNEHILASNAPSPEIILQISGVKQMLQLFRKSIIQFDFPEQLSKIQQIIAELFEKCQVESVQTFVVDKDADYKTFLAEQLDSCNKQNSAQLNKILLMEKQIAGLNKQLSVTLQQDQLNNRKLLSESQSIQREAQNICAAQKQKFDSDREKMTANYFKLQDKSEQAITAIQAQLQQEMQESAVLRQQLSDLRVRLQEKDELIGKLQSQVDGIPQLRVTSDQYQEKAAQLAQTNEITQNMYRIAIERQQQTENDNEVLQEMLKKRDTAGAARVSDGNTIFFISGAREQLGVLHTLVEGYASEGAHNIGEQLTQLLQELRQLARDDDQHAAALIGLYKQQVKRNRLLQLQFKMAQKNNENEAKIKVKQARNSLMVDFKQDIQQLKRLYERKFELLQNQHAKDAAKIKQYRELLRDRKI